MKRLVMFLPKGWQRLTFFPFCIFLFRVTLSSPPVSFALPLHTLKLTSWKINSDEMVRLLSGESASVEQGVVVVWTAAGEYTLCDLFVCSDSAFLLIPGILGKTKLANWNFSAGKNFQSQLIKSCIAHKQMSWLKYIKNSATLQHVLEAEHQ